MRKKVCKKVLGRVGALVLSACLVLCSESSVVYAMQGSEGAETQSEPVITSVEFGEPIIEEIEVEETVVEESAAENPAMEEPIVEEPALNAPEEHREESTPEIEFVYEEPVGEDFVYDAVTVEANELTYKPYENATYELTYTIGEEGIIITGYVGTISNVQLVLPDEIDGVKVVEIGDNAFKYCSGFKGDLVLPSNLKRVGANAFWDAGFAKGMLVISQTVEEIGEYAFFSCEFSGNLVIPDSVTTMGKYAFAQCFYIDGTLTLSKNLKVIEENVFYGCTKLGGNLVIPDGVTDIGANAFTGGCLFSGDLVIPNSVTTIGEQAFYAGDFDGTLTLSENLTSIGKEAFRYCNDFCGDLIVPGNGLHIGDYAFGDCGGFDGDLLILDGVETIGNNAFYYCDSLSGNLVIADSVTSIGNRAFAQCYYIRNLTLSNNLVSIGEKAFHECYDLTGDLIIPDSVTSIGAYAFSSCPDLNGKLVLSKNLTHINDYTFAYCYQIMGDLTIPDGVVSIGSSAFSGCSGFDGNLVLPDNLVEIGDSAFKGCSGLSGNLIIPDSVISIGNYAFYNCDAFSGNLEFPDSVTSIGDYAFYYCSGFDGMLIISDSVTSIGNYAFYYCSGLTGELVLPKCVTSVGDWAFYGCDGLGGELVLPESLTSIGEYAFCSLEKLEGTLVIPDGVTSIGTSAFGYCTGLSGDITMPDSVTTIGALAFTGCSGLSKNIGFNTKYEEAEYAVDEDAFRITSYREDTNIYAPAGTYGETYANTYGYSYVSEILLPEEERIRLKEEETLQPLPDDYEQDTVIPEDKYTILVSDVEGMALDGAVVEVWTGCTLVEQKTGKAGDPVTYSTNADGVVYLDVVQDNYVIKVSSENKIHQVLEVQSEAGKLLRVRLKNQYTLPTVTQVYCTDSNNNTISLLKEDLNIRVGDSEEYTFLVETVNVTSEDVDTIGLSQGSETLYEVAWEGGSSSTFSVKLGEVIKNEQTIYVVGKKNNKLVFAKSLGIRCLSREWIGLQTQSPMITVGSAFSPDTNNDDVPAIWGKGDLEINTLVDFPLKVEYDKNKIKVFVGSSKDLLVEEAPKLNFMSKAEILKTLKERMKSKKMPVEIPVYPCVTVGFGGSIEGGGYLEGELFPEQNGVNVTGSILVKVTATLQGTLQPKVWIIELPAQIYIKGDLSDQIEAKMSLAFQDGKLANAGPFELENQLEFMLSLGGVLGIEDWWEYRAEGGVGVNWTHSFTNSAEPNVVKLKGQAEVSRTILGFTKVYWDWPEKDEQKEIKIYPAEKHGGGGIERAAEVDYEILGRDYLLMNSLVNGGMGSTIVEGVYPYCEPTLVEADGVQYLFYINDLAEREEVDRTALVYRTNSGSGWSSEMVVSEDGTADFAYDVLADEEGIHVVWQNATGSLIAAEGPEDAAAKLELQTALVKGSTVSDVCTLESSEGKYPFSPDLFLSDGKVCAGWYENSENDILSEGKGTNTFYVQVIGTDVKDTLAKSDYFMGSAVFGELDGENCAVFSADIDGNLSTMEDREIMMAGKAGVRSLSFNAVLDSCPKFVELDNKTYVLYYSGGSLVMTDGSTVQTVMETDEFASDSFRVTGDGETAVVAWRDAYSINSEMQSIHMAEYKDGVWTTKGSILDTEERISAFGLCGSVGDAELVYASYDADATQEITSIHVEKADPKGRVELTGLTYDADSFVPGQAFPISLELTDVGEVGAEEIVVRMLKEDDSVAWEKTLTEIPATGASVEVAVEDFVPENTADVKEYRLSVLCDGTENVCEVIQLGGVDFSVSHEITYDENDRMLDVKVKNDSKIAGNVTLTIQTEEETPVTLVEKTYENIAGGSSVYYYCKLESLLEQADGKNVLIKVESDSEESTYINNETTVYNYLAEAPKVSVSVQENGSDVSELNITTGESRQLNAVLTGDNAEGVTVSWASSNPACVSVDNTGKVTALSEGVVRVTATSSEGVEVSVKVSVEKKEVLPAGVSLSDSTLTMTEEERAVLIATVTPSDVTDPTITWSSDNEDVVQVEDGNLLAVAEGTAVITAETVNGLKATCKVTVEKAEVLPTGITLSASTLTMTEEERAVLIATVTPADVTDPTVTWTSDNEDIVQVEDGNLLAVGEGTAVITAETVNGLKATCKVTVEKAEVLPTGITLSASTLTMTEEERAVLIATVTPADVTDPTVTWTSDNEDVVQIDGGNLLAVGEGTAVITAETVNGLKATCKVTVEKATNPFYDVAEDKWYYPFALRAYKEGIMSGVGTDAETGLVKFAPEANITREQFVQILYNREGKPAVEYDDVFPDVPPQSSTVWYSDAIMWASQNNIVSGYNNGLFGVGDKITREQVAVMLLKYATYKGYETTERAELTDFKDVDKIHDWAVDSMKWAVAYGVMSGKSGGWLEPLGNASRAEAATMLLNMIDSYEE